MTNRLYSLPGQESLPLGDQPSMGTEQRATLQPPDFARIKTQKDRLKLVMLTYGGWWTLAELRQRAGGSDTGNSAALRALRKEHCLLDTQRRADGLWLYRLRKVAP